MKKFGYLSVLVLSSCASSPMAHFVDRGLFNNTPFVTAKGKSPDEAKAKALAAMPTDFEVDKSWSAPVMSCGQPGEVAESDKIIPDVKKCPSGIYRVDVAVLPKSGPERDAIIASREAYEREQEERQPSGSDSL